MDIEQQLQKALKREQPSPGLAQRVLAEANRKPRTEDRGRFSAWRAIAAAVAFTAILGGWTAHTIIEQRAGERARDEVKLALQIAGSKLKHAQTQVQEIGKR